MSLAETAASFVVALGAVLAQSAPFVVLGYAVAALLHEFVAVETLTQGFGRSAGSVLRAVGVGLLLPVCSCGVVPLGVGLRRGGAALGTVLAFFVAAPATSPVAILVAWNTIGPPLTVIWTAAVLLAATVLGLVVNRLERGGEANPPLPVGTLAASDTRPLWRRVVKAGRWAFLDLGADVSVDLTAGLALAALLLTVVPAEWIARGLGPSNGVVAVLVAIAVALPAYTCTIPTIPVVRSLLLLGAAPGAALAFLIVGPATNLGELNVIRAQLGTRAVLALVLALVSAAIVGAAVVTLAFPIPPTTDFEAARQLVATTCCVPLPVPGVDGTSAPAPAGGHLAAIPAWHWPFALVLGATLAVGLVRRARRWLGRAPATQASSVPAPNEGGVA